MPDRIAYKIMLPAEAAQMRRDGIFHGSAADIADGYIHLSGADQLAATLDKYFAGIAGLMLAAVDLSQLGDTVRWEPSRNQQLFPHIYGALPFAALVSFAALQRDADGLFLGPALLANDGFDAPLDPAHRPEQQA